MELAFHILRSALKCVKFKVLLKPESQSQWKVLLILDIYFPKPLNSKYKNWNVIRKSGMSETVLRKNDFGSTEF